MAAGEFGKLIALVRNQMMAKLDDALKEFDLTGSQFAVIKLIAEGKGDTLAKLCDCMQHDKGAMSRILSRMEDKSLIFRKPCPDDGRAFRLALTQKGQDLFPKTTPKIHALYDAALKGFSESEREQFFAMLTRCQHNLCE